MNKGALLASAMLIAFAGSAQAEDGATLAAKFGALEEVEHVSLSPDGVRVAVVTPVAGGTRVMIADMVAGGEMRSVMGIAREQGRVSWCAWPSAQRLVCQARYIVDDAGLLLPYTRLFAVNADGSELREVSGQAGSNARGLLQNGGTIIDFDVSENPGTVLMTRQFLPTDVTGSRVGSRAEGLGVEVVDTLTLKRQRAEAPRPDATEYISDGHGTVRIMGQMPVAATGYLSGTVKYFYRKPGSREWEPLSTVTSDAGQTSGFDPYAVDSAKNLVYGFDDHEGFTALYSLSLDGKAARALVLSRPDTDVDKLVRIGRHARVVGASYANERRTVEYFDPQLRALSAGLRKALPGQPLVEIVDASEDESKLLIVASADTDPGKVYLFDKATRNLAEVLPLRARLAGIPLAAMKPVSFKAADGTEIPGYLTLPSGSSGKGLPAIVMPHGGPGARDEWGFDWLAQFFAARGYAVLQPNFRGSTGYGSAWFQKNGFQSWRTAIDDVNDAGRWLLAQGIAAPGKLGIVGWSYGGYAALQGAVVDPELYKAVVAIAPVTDLAALKQENRNYLSGAMVARFVGEGPHVREGSPAQNADRIKAPVLLFHGDRDLNVAIAESRLMADKLKDAGKAVTLVEFPGLDHQLPSTAARTRLLAQSDAFLRTALGLPAE